MQDTSCAHGLQKFPVRPAGQKRVYRRHSDRVEATNGVIPSVSGHRKLLVGIDYPSVQMGSSPLEGLYLKVSSVSGPSAKEAKQAMQYLQLCE